MKYLFAVLLLSLSSFSFASGGTGGVPSVPCTIDGDYKGTFEITKCNEMKVDAIKQK